MLSLVASQLLELPLPDWIPSARTVEEEEEKEVEEVALAVREGGE